MIRLNVFIRVAAENRAAALQAAKELVAASLSDKGCIAHQKSAHFTTLVPRIESLGEMKLEQFEF